MFVHVIPGRRGAANPEPMNTDINVRARTAAPSPATVVFMGSGFAGDARAPE
jgi:hypothetical protein